jgi:hypothetical protein
VPLNRSPPSLTMGPYLLDLIATYDALTALIVGLQVVQLQKTTEKNQVPHPPQTPQNRAKTIPGK